MRLHYNLGATDKISTIDVEKVMISDGEMFLIGNIENGIYPPREDGDNEFFNAVRVLQDVEDECFFYFSDTVLKETNHTEAVYEEIDDKYKFYFSFQKVFPWVQVNRALTDPNRDRVVFIPNGIKKSLSEAFPHLGLEGEAMLYDDITDQVKVPEL